MKENQVLGYFSGAIAVLLLLVPLSVGKAAADPITIPGILPLNTFDPFPVFRPVNGPDSTIGPRDNDIWTVNFRNATNETWKDFHVAFHTNTAVEFPAALPPFVVGPTLLHFDDVKGNPFAFTIAELGAPADGFSSTGVPPNGTFTLSALVENGGGGTPPLIMHYNLEVRPTAPEPPTWLLLASGVGGYFVMLLLRKTARRSAM